MFFKKLLAALASLGLVSLPAAHAVLTAGTSDVFIGFHQTSNNTDYLIDIGPVSSLLTATDPIVFSLGATSTDLVSTFGSGWYSDSTVSWGVVGTNEAFTPILYSSVARTSVAVPADPWPLAPSATSQRSVGNSVKNLKADFKNFGNPTANSSVATFQDVSGLDFAYADFTTESPSFGASSTWTTVEGNFDPANGRTLDFYQYTTTSATLIGSFTIDSGGIVTFTPVPEPAAGVLAALGLLAVTVLRRRRAASLS